MGRSVKQGFFFFPLKKKMALNMSNGEQFFHVHFQEENQTHPPSDSRIFPCNSHKMTQQCVGPQKTQTDVGSLCPVLEGLRVWEVVGARSAID